MNAGDLLSAPPRRMRRIALLSLAILGARAPRSPCGGRS